MADEIKYSTTGKPHPYHIVRPSPWPLVGACAAGFLATMTVMFMHGVKIGGVTIGVWGPVLGLASVAVTMFLWWKDVIFEAVKEKAHTPIAEIGMRYGMALFIASEVMFFVAFFWAFFNSSLFPTDAIGNVWPPANIETISPFELPLLMTMVLLLSGCTVTWAHHALIHNQIQDAAKALGLSVLLGVCFIGLQAYEYVHAHFGFTEGVYASTFFMATGFHGFHVIVGTIFLYVCYLRTKKGHFNAEHHFGFEAAAWYWHFVDVVWLFLFISIYWWGNTVGVSG